MRVVDHVHRLQMRCIVHSLNCDRNFELQRQPQQAMTLQLNTMLQSRVCYRQSEIEMEKTTNDFRRKKTELCIEL